MRIKRGSGRQSKTGTERGRERERRIEREIVELFNKVEIKIDIYSGYILFMALFGSSSIHRQNNGYFVFIILFVSFSRNNRENRK